MKTRNEGCTIGSSTDWVSAVDLSGR
jgi:hypothetical protein